MITTESKAQRVFLRSEPNLSFDHYALRLIVGGIAFLFPFVVYARATAITSSISASYYTNARDFFVGFLFVIGALFVGYKGHKPELAPNKVGRFWQWMGSFLNWLITFVNVDFRMWGRKHEEDMVSTIGGLAALTAALYPTACDGCVPDTKSHIHIIAAVILFSTVVYFCLVAFLRSVKAKLQIDKRATTRRRVYLSCGWGIALMMLGSLVVSYAFPAFTSNKPHLTFWVESVALWLFGIAWLTASQFKFLLNG